MDSALHELNEHYREALAEYLEDNREETLHQAYELGRRAMISQVSLLDLGLIHHKALAGVLKHKSVPNLSETIKAASTFFMESLALYEMTLSGFREASDRIDKLRMLLLDGTPKNAVSLTARELNILRLLSLGLNTSAIAEKLVLQPVTVSNHISRILTKLGVHSRVEAIAAANRAGLL